MLCAELSRFFCNHNVLLVACVNRHARNTNNLHTMLSVLQYVANMLCYEYVVRLIS